MNIDGYKEFFKRVSELLGMDRPFKISIGWAIVEFKPDDISSGVCYTVMDVCNSFGVRWCNVRRSPGVMVFVPDPFRDELISTGVLR